MNVAESSVPEGWVSAKVGDVADYINGMAFKPTDWEGIGRPIIRIQNLTDPRKAFNYTSKDVDDRLVVHPGEILVSWSATLDAFVWEGPEAVLNQHIFRVVPRTEVVDRRFLFWGLKKVIAEMWLSEHTHGSTMRHINRGPFLAHPLPLPPLAEQRRIVAKVESLLAEVNAARERLDKVPAILKRFRQSVLAAACSGRLTEDWRADHPDAQPARDVLRSFSLKVRRGTDTKSGDADSTLPLPDTWDWCVTERLCDPDRALTYGVIKLGPPITQGVPTLRSSDVRWLGIDRANIKTISHAIADAYHRTKLSGGEVVVTVRGTLGGVAAVPSDMAGFNVSREVAVLPVRHPLVPSYVAMAVASKESQNWLTERTKGATYTGINIEDLRRLPLPMPPVSEQAEIVVRVERLLGLSSSIESRVGNGATSCSFLGQGVLAKAFRGELVQTEAELAHMEGRDYEPAAALLASIRAERNAQANSGGRKERQSGGAVRPRRATSAKAGRRSPSASRGGRS